jgi:mannose-6-phosphate isomerase-like protein (cupin superfamily)
MQTNQAWRKTMPTRIDKPTRIEAAGNKPKLIEEYVGRVNNGESAVSIAHMHSPAGWIEPGQTPEFDEYTIVLRGVLRVESREGTLDVHAGQAVVVRRGEWVRYSTPGQDGAEYIAVCLTNWTARTCVLTSSCRGKWLDSTDRSLTPQACGLVLSPDVAVLSSGEFSHPPALRPRRPRW